MSINKLTTALLVPVIGLSLVVFLQLTRPPELFMGGTRYFYEVAKTPESQRKGLSNRKSLAEDHALLFVYERASILEYWMKDMNFPIDIVWMDETYTVLHIDRHVLPGSYPKTYSSEQPAKSGIEVNAGRASEVSVGDIVYVQ